MAAGPPSRPAATRTRSRPARGHVDHLFEVAVDAQLALVGAVDRRAGDELAQRVRGARGLVRVADAVELAEHLEPRSRAPGRRSGVRSAAVGLKRRHSRSSTSGPDSRRVERSSASRSARIASVSCSDSRTTRRCESSERSSGAAAGAAAGRAAASASRAAGAGRADTGRRRSSRPRRRPARRRGARAIPQRAVQPPQRIGPLGIRAQAAQRALGLGAAVLEQRVEPYRQRLDVELQRLARGQAADQLAERVADLLALGRRHHQRVLRRDAQVAHQRALAGHQQPLAIDRLDAAQLARLRQRPRLAAAQTSHSTSSVGLRLPR